MRDFGNLSGLLTGASLLAAVFYSTNASSALLIYDDFSDTGLDYSQTVGGRDFNHATDVANGVTQNFYWEKHEIYSNRITHDVYQEADGNGGNQLVINSASQRGAGLVFDGVQGIWYQTELTEETSDRAVNYVDPELDIFNAELTFVLDNIQIQGALDPRYHHLLFGITSLSTQAMQWNSFEVQISMDGTLRARTMQDRSIPSFVSLVPENISMPGAPSRVELKLNATHYEINLQYSLDSSSSQATRTMNGQSFNSLQGGTLSYRGEHGLDMDRWRRTLRSAGDSTATDVVGSAFFVGAQSTSLDLSAPLAERATTVRIGSIAISSTDVAQ